MDNKLINACYFASVKHVNQRRKNTNKDPYINHPIEVMYILKQNGINDIDTLCGALLHDVIEDTNTTKEEIINLFGEDVYNIVEECSDNKSLDKITRKKNQIKHSATISDKAKLVKLADKYSNVNGLLNDPPANWSNEEIIGCAKWSYVVCEQLYGVKGGELLDNLLKELFNKFGLMSSITNEELENYYKIIHNSE